MKIKLFKNLSVQKKQLFGLISISILSSALAYPIIKVFLNLDLLTSRLRVSFYTLSISLFLVIVVSFINRRLTIGTDDRVFFNIIVFILIGTIATLVGLGLFLLLYSLILY